MYAKINRQTGCGGPSKVSRNCFLIVYTPRNGTKHTHVTLPESFLFIPTGGPPAMSGFSPSSDRRPGHETWTAQQVAQARCPCMFG